MPLLQFYLSPDMLTSTEKAELAALFTARYTPLMPGFFVNIIFHEILPDSFFVGGKLTDGKVVSIVIEHIAVSYGDDEARAQRFLDFVADVLERTLGPKGYRWEYHVTQSERTLWRLQGLVPPALDSDAMKLWTEEGKAVPYVI